MTIVLNTFASIIIGHFIADWLLQNRELATTKSRSLFHLSAHVGIYCMAMLCVSYFTFDNFEKALLFTIFNTSLHFLTDFLTSKLTTYFYVTKNDSYFWHTIGFDQTLHFLPLYWIYEWINSPDVATVSTSTLFQSNFGQFLIGITCILSIVLILAAAFYLSINVLTKRDEVLKIVEEFEKNKTKPENQ